jgi:flagellar protein FliT
MSTSSPILNQYQIIASLSSQILAEARLSHWDPLTSLARQYQLAVEALRHMNQLSSEDRAARQPLLAQILDDDARLRNLAAPELKRLGALLGQTKGQRSVSRACGAHG